MKHKFLSNLLSTLELVLFLGILIAGLQKMNMFREAGAVSPANAQNAFQDGSEIVATATLPSVEVYPMGHQVITSTTSGFSSEFSPNSYFKTFEPSHVFSHTIFFSKNITPTDFDGGEYKPSYVPPLTDQQRQEIQKKIDQNIQRLGLRRPKDITPFSASLSWPLQATNGLTDYSYYGTSNFADHNPAFPNQLLDYRCGNRTYDLSSGYNHQGVDIFTWPFGWNKMDNDEVEVMAAAPGIIVFKQDGNFDRSCGINNNNPWNAVYIQHSDGSIIWYGHLKKFSVTSKPVGAAVAKGEYLGIVGSSGSSTNPHLHLELYDADGNLIDPYAGPCNPIASWWTAQRPYYDSAVNKITTGSAAAVFPTCPNPEISNAKNRFDPGDQIYFTTYYRDQLSSLQSQYTIYRPNGSVYQRWTHGSSEGHYAASYWSWSFILGTNVPLGVWKFEVVFNGQTYVHNFNVSRAVYLPAILKVFPLVDEHSEDLIQMRR